MNLNQPTMRKKIQVRESVSSSFDPVESVIEAIGRGELVIVVDDEARENEGDLVLAAEK